jgi:hypothetical protein
VTPEPAPGSQRRVVRFIVPSEAYVSLVASLAKQSDAMLLLVQRVCRAVEQHGDDKLLEDLTVIVQAVNGHGSDMRAVLRAILEEQPTEAMHGRA